MKTDKRERKRRENRGVQELAFLLAGICSVLLVLWDLPYVFLSPAVAVAAVLLCAGLYALRTVRPGWIFYGEAGSLLVCLLAAVVRRREFDRQIQALLRSLTDTAARGEENVTFAALLLSGVLVVLFFQMEMVWKQHWFPYLVTMAVLAVTPLFGIRIGMLPVLAGLVFQVLFWSVHGGTRSSREERRQKREREQKRERRLRGKCTAFTGAALAVLTAVSCLITALWGTGLSQAASDGEGFLSRSVRRMTGIAEIPVSDGHVSGGNNYRTGETQLEVILLTQPTETLYLKGFSGGDYTGGEWELAEEGPLFDEIARELEWVEWASWIRGIYSTLYFSMNETTTEQMPRTVFLHHIGQNYQTLYTPYYSGWAEYRNLQQSGYGYNYYEESEMAIDWDNIPEDYTTVRDWYRQVGDTYMEVMPETYTQVPEDLLPRLTELCARNPMNSREEVTAFLQTLFQSTLSYTLTPGRAPLNEDIVEYFLFESREGYCVHFTSAATLIYRLYGIPARYAAGYAVQPSAFLEQEDGTWRAKVTDESAHAWTELYLEEYGWTPVDVTPASDGAYHISYPGLDAGTLAGLSDGIRLNLSVSSETAGSAGSTETGNRTEGADGFDTFTIDLSGYHDQILVLSAVSVETLLLLPAFLDYRRLRRRKQMEQMSCRRIFGRFLNMLHDAGRLTGCQGTEKNFPARLAREIPSMTSEEADRLTEIVRRAAYGKEAPSREETEYVRGLYLRTADQLCEELKGLKKLWFQYLKAY